MQHSGQFQQWIKHRCRWSCIVKRGWIITCIAVFSVVLPHSDRSKHDQCDTPGTAPCCTAPHCRAPMPVSSSMSWGVCGRSQWVPGPAQCQVAAGGARTSPPSVSRQRSWWLGIRGQERRTGPEWGGWGRGSSERERRHESAVRSQESHDPSEGHDYPGRWRHPAPAEIKHPLTPSEVTQPGSQSHKHQMKVIHSKYWHIRHYFQSKIIYQCNECMDMYLHMY